MVIFDDAYEGLRNSRTSSQWPSVVSRRSMKLVDYTGRLFRQGKASISAELIGIFERSAAVLKTGRTAWSSSATVGCWVVSSRPPAPNCGSSPSPRHAAASERGGLSCQMTRNRIASNCRRPIASLPCENAAALMHI